MSKRSLQAIITNFSALALGRLVAGVFNVVALIFIANSLGAGDFGTYSLALTLGILYGTLSQFGLSGLVTREVAREPSTAKFYLSHGLLSIAMIGIPLFALALWGIAQAYPSQAGLLVWGVVSGLPKLVMDYVNALLFGIDHVPKAAKFTAYHAVGSSALALVMIALFKTPLIQIFQAQLLWGCLLLLWLLLELRAVLPHAPKQETRLRQALLLLKRSVPFGIFALGSLLYFHADTLMLASMRNVTEVGYLQAAMRIILAIDVFPVMLVSALYPMASRLFTQDREGFSRLSQILLRYLLVLALPMAFVVSETAPLIIGQAFGPDFQASIPLLALLAWLIPIRFCGHLFGIILSASNRQAGRAAATVAATVLNIGLNGLMIPSMGAAGAGIASLATSAGLVIFYALSSVKELNLRQMLPDFGRLAISSGAMALVALLAEPHGPILAASLATLTFAGSCLLLGVVPKAELATFWGAFRRREISVGIH